MSMRTPTWLLALLALLLALSAAAWQAQPDGLLRVAFLATPGDAVLLIAPNGAAILIDGGSDPALLAIELGRRLPFWRRTLDAVVLTRADSDRLPGQLAALNRYHAALALAPGGTIRGAAHHRWHELLGAAATPLLEATPGKRLLVGGLTLVVLAVPASKEEGLVLRVEAPGTTLLLAPRLQATQEALLLRTAAVDLAYLPWQRVASDGLLARLRPRAIVYADAFAADEPAVLSYRERAWGGAALYHEKIDGTVELLADRHHHWITTAPP